MKYFIRHKFEQKPLMQKAEQQISGIHLEHYVYQTDSFA